MVSLTALGESWYIAPSSSPWRQVDIGGLHAVVEAEFYCVEDEGNEPSANAEFCWVKGMISALMRARLHGYQERL